MNMLNEMLAASLVATVPATVEVGRPVDVMHSALMGDLRRQRADYKRRAVTGNAPGFVEGVKESLATSNQAHRREIADVDIAACELRRDSMTGDLQLLTPSGEALRIRRHAFEQLARSAGAPGSYLASIGTEQSLAALRWGISEHTTDRPARTLRVEGDEIRAIVSGRYSALDDRQAYRLVYRALEQSGKLDEAQVESWSVGKTSALHVSFGDVRGPASGGMVSSGGEGYGLRAGVMVRNSELGTGSLKISSSLWRHWCDNGCTIERVAGASWSRRHTGDWQAQAAELAEALRDIIETSERVIAVAQPRAAADLFDVDALQARLGKIKVTRAERALIAREALSEACGQYDFDAADPGALANADARRQADDVFDALQQRRLEDETDAVLAALKGAPQVSAWDLVNGVTAAGRIAAENGNTERGAELEAQGGAILAQYLTN